MLLALFFIAIPSLYVAGQCGTIINSFPYNEDFEASKGNWFDGGISSDWAWGKPSKSIINAAANGQKCWITGGLSGNNYNLGEQAWLQSPCFDFSGLQHPYINFKVFWETESQFDGASLEYSTDNGITWKILGSFNDPQNCFNGNWFNNPSIVKLPASQGWSGSISSGDGSGAWVTAQHTLPYLAAAPKVIFRFFFGAGTVQNNFNGFAIDDISIGEAPPNNADFTFNCTAVNTVTFSSISSVCPTTYFWDFDDIASGASNTSSQIMPVHTFSGSGTYNVSLTTSGPDNAPSTILKPVTILSLAAGIPSSKVDCNGSNTGVATVIATGGNGVYNYNWNTNPIQTNATATNLAAGNYTVTVSSSSACSTSKDFIITEPPQLKVLFNTGVATCGSSDASISATVSGGTTPYNYSWQPVNINSATINNIPSGKYFLTVIDNNGCSISDSTIVKDSNTLKINLSAQSSLCGNSNGVISATVSGGKSPYNYTWQPTNINSAVINVASGKYILTVTDVNGCLKSDSIIVKDTNTLNMVIAAQSSVCGNSNGSINTVVSGGMAPFTYTWQPPNINAPDLINIAAGKYLVTVIDLIGCTIEDSIIVKDTNTLRISLGKDTTICEGDIIQLNPGTFINYSWQDNSTQSIYAVSKGGTYWVRVTDVQNCIAADTIAIVSDCGEIDFPTAFTPNGDGKNDFFGPLGNLAAVNNYRLLIYNRWGKMIFQSTDPFKKWDGKTSSGKTEVNTYTWFSTFNFREQQNIFRKGTITIIK